MRSITFFVMALAMAALATVGVYGEWGGEVTHAQGGGLAPPTNVTATTAGSSVTVSWTNSPDAAGHLVMLFRSDWSGDPLVATPTGSAHTFNSVPDGSYIAIAFAFDASSNISFAISGIVTVNASGSGGPPSPTPDPTRDVARPSAPSRYSAISAGDLHTCGLKLDGSVDCFGSDGRGQSSPPTGEFLQVAAGGVHTCGIRASDSTVACWGSAAVPSGPAQIKIAQIDSGFSHSCGIVARVSNDATHKIICWGATGLDRTEDFESSRNTPIHSISVGDNHNCSMWHNRREMRCWGSNEAGQSVSRGGSRVEVSAGGSHTCWLNEDGTVECQGDNTSGQSSPPAASEGDFDQEAYTYSAISAGKNHTCAIEADGNSVQTVGTVRCWGSNDAGQSTPPSGVVFDAISAGSNHTCGLKADGTARCWGDNSFGQAPSAR